MLGAIIGAVSQIGGGILGQQGSIEGAQIAAQSRDAATREQARQFDITQAQLEPFRAAGLRGLSQYEQMLGQYGDIPISNNLPAPYQSNRDLATFSFAPGDYGHIVQSNLPGEFSYSNQDFQNDPLRNAAIAGGNQALANRGLNAYDPSLAGNLATNTYSAARGNAYQDYQSRVEREGDVYNRSAQEYQRRTSREDQLYNLERQRYLDSLARSATTDQRAYQQYQTEVAREAEQRQRDLETYGRLYTDPLSRYAQLAGIGQATTTGLGSLRQSYADRVSANTIESGRLLGAGQLGAQNAWANAAGNIAQIYGENYGR